MAGEREVWYSTRRTHLERDAGDGVAPGVGDLGRRRGGVQHARKRLPLVQADGVPHEQYLLPLPSPQKLLPVEPGIGNGKAGRAIKLQHAARSLALGLGAPRFDGSRHCLMSDYRQTDA